jgi:hypothetical protein
MMSIDQLLLLGHLFIYLVETYEIHRQKKREGKRETNQLQVQLLSIPNAI